MSHTPGPWRIDPDLSNIGKAGVTTANSEYEFSVNGGYEPEYLQIEDARLIAAAPELLAALKECIGWIDPDDTRLVNYEEARRVLASAESAIAKAEGRDVAS